MRLADWVGVSAFSFLFICDTVKSSLPQAHQEGALRPYKSYADITLFHYYIPPESSIATFEFAAFMDSAKCPVRQAFIYVQHGSYPVMSADNATFPENFWVNRTSLSSVVAKSSYNTHDAVVLPIYNPLPGNWFAAAYLNTWDQKVQQEGLGHKCRYSLGSVGLWSLTPDVVTIPLKSTMQLTSSKHFSYYKFYIPSGVLLFTLEINGCKFLTSRRFEDSISANEVYGNNNERQQQGNACIHNIFLRDRALPFYKSNQTNSSLTNDEGSSFSHTEKLPLTDVYYYLLIVSESKVSYNVTILVEEFNSNCPLVTLGKSLVVKQFSAAVINSSASSSTSIIGQVNVSAVASNFTPSTSQANNNYNVDGYSINSCPCVPMFRLTRIRHAQDFSDTFLLEGKEWFTTWLPLTDSVLVGTSFELLPFIDIGGTLSIGIHLDEILMNVSIQTVHVNVCIKQGRRPGTFCCNHPEKSSEECCGSGISLKVSSRNLSEVDDIRYIPFPEADVYYMSFKMHCEFEGVVVPCAIPDAVISLDIRTQPCVLRKQSSQGGQVSACGSYGFCQEVHKSQYFYTACRCVAGYRGWACNDDSEAVPKNVLLMTTLLLTLSNIFFIPAILLACIRRMFVQAFIYSCTMISSTLYHACDQELYGYCLTRYSVLQFCDFFCSILAFWVTIITIVHSPPQYDAVLYIFGAVLIAIGVEYNRTGLLVFVVPFGIGFAYIVSMWIFRSIHRRAIIVPKVGRLLLFVPGVLLGASGLILFAFVETEDNYRYTHSAWHTIIAISLLYLLPKRRSSMKMQMSNSSSAEMANVSADYQQASTSPVFFITSELDHLVQDRVG